MFLSAMARPRYDAQGNCTFDGKIGVWAFVEWVQAQKRSANRFVLEHKLTSTYSKDHFLHYLNLLNFFLLIVG